MSRVTEDPRIDPRIKAVFGAMDLPPAENAGSREELLAQANSEEAVATQKMFKTFLDGHDSRH